MSIFGFNIDTSKVPKMDSSQTIGGKIQEASKTFNEFLKSSPGDKNTQDGSVSEDNNSNLVFETTETTETTETENSENIEETEQIVGENLLVDNQNKIITNLSEQKSSVNGQSVMGSSELSDSTSLSNGVEKKQSLDALNNSLYKGFLMDDQIDTDQIELLDEVNIKNINGNKFQNDTNKVIKSIMGATNKVIINDEITLKSTTEGMLEEITTDSEISQEDVQLKIGIKGIESSSKSDKGSIFNFNSKQNNLEQIKELATERLSTKNELIEEKSKDNLDIISVKDLGKNNLNLDQIISSPLFPIQMDQTLGKNTSKTTESNDTMDQTFINSTSKDLNNIQMNEISKVQRTSFSEHISKIMDQKEMISKLWSKSYVEFENGQRVDVFARKYENEFQFRIETNQSELQQKIENEVDKIKEGLQSKFETDINFFFGKNDDSQSNEGAKSTTQKLNPMKDSDHTKDEVSNEGISQKSLGYNSNEWVA
tara:strand:- start:6694 stop:8142 length:1449 start_codon:yes stop_codon:yes gene_type:complete